MKESLLITDAGVGPGYHDREVGIPHSPPEAEAMRPIAHTGATIDRC